jgi:SAM-dependent methyltransferase
VEPSFSPAWFKTFGRPDGTITASEVMFLESILPPPPATVLDVPCGFGRHAQALAAHGYAVTGVEREPAVAAAARAGGIDVHELDLRRLDELPGRFDAVICMWASFGWYDDDTNAAVFAAMADKAKRMLVLDVYDPSFFREHQGTTDNRGVRDEKHVEGDRLVTVLDYPDGTRDRFEWRLYEPEELAELGRSSGLRLERADGEGTPRRRLVFERA